MPTDWLFYWMMQPSGLLLIGLAIVIPFLFWRLVLSKSFATTGFKPLIIAYACAALGLVVLNFLSSYIEFSDRVSSGLLQEAQRWSTVPRWTVYTAVLSLIFVLPVLALVGVPLAALLLRVRMLTYVSIALVAVSLWLTLTVLAWAFPINEWHRAHRFASFTGWLTELLPGILLIAVPFLLGVHGASNSARHTGL